METAPLSRGFLASLTQGGWRELSGLARFTFLPESQREALAFAVRGWIATCAALYLAFVLQLDEPYWAGMAIWMVAQPTPGMAISKSYYRIVGTVVGAIMGVLLVAFFAQSPELFILALALWIGGCTVASNLLRNFRAYGTVLAGYTAAIVALGAYGHPEQAFDIGIARATATIIGIACTTVITALFAPHRAEAKVRGLLRQVIGDTARRLALPIDASMRDRLAIGKPLIDNLIALDAEVDFAAAESAPFRIHATGARSLVAHLFSALAARRSLEEHLQRTGPLDHPAISALLKATLDLFRSAPQMIVENKREHLEVQAEALRKSFGEIRPEDETLSPPELVVTARVTVDRLDDVLSHFIHALQDWHRLQAGWIWQPSLHLDFHRDRRAALINGLRVALAVLASGAFWIATAWSAGSLMLIQLAAVCSLYSSSAEPDVQSTNFFKGVLFSIVGAFICNYCLLQNVSGFPLLALIMGLFIIPGALAFLIPKYSGIGLAFCVLFIGTVRPLNQMDYDMVSFLNNAVASLLGVGCGVLCFKLFLPPDPAAARRYVVYRIRLGLYRISQWTPIPTFNTWQTRMYDRINRLHNPGNPSGQPTDEWFNGGLASLGFGNEVLRLRHLLAEGKLSSPVAKQGQSVLQAFSEIVTHPELARRSVHAARESLQQNPPRESGESRVAWCRALGIFEEMEAFFTAHPKFLTPS